MSAPPIQRHALFDFGGPVLLSPFELTALGERALGLAPGSLPRGPFDVDGDPGWRAFQAGEITERAYWAVRSEAVGLDTKGFMHHHYEPPGEHLVRPETWQVIRDVRAAGFRSGVLTNDLTAFHGEAWCVQMRVLRDVDPLVDLSVSGRLKPHPEAYALGIEAMGAPADRIVFLDDQPANIAGAAEAGLVTVWFDITDAPGSIKRFRAALTAP
jgi:putative hydrolase of the HAD superfamily